MRAVLIGAYNQKAPHWMGQMQAARRMGWQFITLDPTAQSDAQIIDRAREFEPDFILHGLADSLKSNLPDKLKEKTGATQVWWFCDYTFYEDGYDNPWFWRDWSGVFDMGLLCNKEQLSLYEERMNIPFHFLPMAGMRMIPGVTYRHTAFTRYDVSFEGNVDGGIYKERTDLLNALHEKYPVHVYAHTSPSCFDDNIPYLYQQSAISLSLSATHSANGYTSPRLFMIALNGGFPLAKHFPGIEELTPYVPTFTTPDEYKEQVEYFLDRPDELERRRRKILRYAQTHHTYAQRMKQMQALCFPS